MLGPLESTLIPNAVQGERHTKCSLHRLCVVVKFGQWEGAETDCNLVKLIFCDEQQGTVVFLTVEDIQGVQARRKLNFYRRAGGTFLRNYCALPR
jgi:hypothetical protein